MKKQNDIPQPIRGDEGATVKIPRNIERDRQNPDMLVPPETDNGTVSNMKFSFSDTHNRLEKGGYAREVTVRELPISENLASVNMRLKPGAIRELHWHKEAEWAYMIYGSARVTIVDEQGRSFIDDVAKEIFGTSRQACRTPFKRWMREPSSCSCLTMAHSLKTAPSS